MLVLVLRSLKLLPFFFHALKKHAELNAGLYRVRRMKVSAIYACSTRIFGERTQYSSAEVVIIGGDNEPSAIFNDCGHRVGYTPSVRRVKQFFQVVQ